MTRCKGLPTCAHRARVAATGEPGFLPFAGDGDAVAQRQHDRIHPLVRGDLIVQAAHHLVVFLLVGRVEDPAALPAALDRAVRAVTIEKRQALLNVICRGV